VPAPARARRIPLLAAVAWLLALAGLVALGVAVAHYLGAGPASGMAGHHHGTADALYRAGGSPAGPLLGGALLTAWHLDAVAVAVLLLLGAMYFTAVGLVPVRTGGEHWPVRRSAAFVAGLAVCAFATNGSIAVYDQTLFTAHMLGHLALVMVAPALLVCGRPVRLAIAATPPATSARIARIATGRVVSVLTAPPVALASYTAVIVGSHLTGLMDKVMTHTWAGQVEHLVYLVVGIQFFVLVIGDEPIRWRLASPAKWLLLAVGMAVDTFTGIVLLQGTRVVSMLPLPGADVDPLSDTRTGGAIMWFGGDAIMAAIMVVLVVGWLREAETATRDEPGWLEQARRATFTGHVGDASSETAEAMDEDEAARGAYNEWLARLDKQR
jgi:putative copper resistance protein D